MATAKSAASVVTGPTVVIKPARLTTRQFHIVGTSPLVQARFSGKAMQAMMSKMQQGSQAGKSRAKDPRDFDADFENAKHVGTDGKQGIPAGAFRQAMISACRLVGFKMTLAKLSVFIEADDFDRIDGIPLVHFNGTPERLDMAVRNATGVADIRVRPMWRQWDANLRIRFDEDQFSATDVTNLLVRVGQQVGIGEGRPDSRESAGLGWGTFRVE
jgi:hypothetical protein